MGWAPGKIAPIEIIVYKKDRLDSGNPARPDIILRDIQINMLPTMYTFPATQNLSDLDFNLLGSFIRSNPMVQLDSPSMFSYWYLKVTYGLPRLLYKTQALKIYQ